MVLPLKYLESVVEPLPGEQTAYPVLEVSDYTVLVVKIPGKQVQQAVLEWIGEKQLECSRLPPPSSRRVSTRPGVETSETSPLLLFDSEQ